MDTRDTRVQNLLFLLSAAPLGVACIITDDGTTDTEAATSTPTTGGGTTETPGTDTVVATDTGTSEGPVSTDDRGETTETPADTTMTPEDTTTGGGDIPPACASYGDAIEACFAGYGADAAASCANYHATYTENYGAECVAAYEDFLACLSALTCEELMMDPADVCVAEQDAQAMVCVAK
jgi:hypothetical protein